MKYSFGFVLAWLLVLALAGCSLPGMPVPTPSLPALPPVASKAPPINTLPPLPTFTKSASTPQVITTTLLPTLPAPTKGAADTAVPTKPAAALPTATKPAPVQPTATKPAATQAPATKVPATAVSAKEAKIFMVAINDNGASGKKIGCGDSIVPVTITLADPAAPLRGALDKLLAVHTQFYGQSGLYNALFRSDLRLNSVTIKDTVAEIKLSGSLTLGGVCNSPRVWAQFEETALQFSTVKSVNILVNGKKLQDLLSSK